MIYNYPIGKYISVFFEGETTILGEQPETPTLIQGGTFIFFGLLLLNVSEGASVNETSEATVGDVKIVVVLGGLVTFLAKGTEDGVVLLSLLLSCNTAPMITNVIIIITIVIMPLLQYYYYYDYYFYYYYFFHHISLLLSFSAPSFCFLILPTWLCCCVHGNPWDPPISGRSAAAIGRT